MPRPRAIAPALAVLTALVLAGCTPDGGVATPTPTELTQDQAYTAAEDAFRAYIDAINQIDVADPATFEAAFALTTGRQNSFDRQQYSTWHADEWVKSGEVSVRLIEPASFQRATGVVRLNVCIDASDAGLVDASGVSQVSPDRPEVAAYTAEVTDREGNGAFLVNDVLSREGDPPCG